jgi:hypothetical protein
MAQVLTLTLHGKSKPDEMAAKFEHLQRLRIMSMVITQEIREIECELNAAAHNGFAIPVSREAMRLSQNIEALI